MYGVQVLSLARARGGLEALEPMTRSMVEQFPLIPSWRCGLVYLYRDLGRLEDARPPFEILAGPGFTDLQRDANWLIGIALLASVCASLEDAPRAAALYDLLAPLQDATVLAGLPAEIYGSVHDYLMPLAAVLDRWDDAEMHFEAGQAANERMGCRSFSLIAQAEWGRLLAARGRPGDVDRARAVFEACRSASAAVGMVRLVDGCDVAIARLVG